MSDLNFFSQVRQSTCYRKKGTEFLCITQINITDDTLIAFAIKPITKKNGKEKFLPHLDGKIWKKNYQVEDKGSFTLSLDDKRTITASQASTGFSITIKRLVGGFFKFDLTVTQNPEAVLGLCTDTEVIEETSQEPDPTSSVTHVSCTVRILNEPRHQKTCLRGL